MRPFLLTVDAEPDDVAWQGLSHRVPFHFESLQGLRRFAEVARVLELRPTLLVTYSVAAHPEFRRLLAETGLEARSEIGAHFHPADTPPFGPWDAVARDNLARVPDDVLPEKFARLHEILTHHYGPPRSFRGGAWTLDARVLGLLRAHGYVVDSTVTPGISWLANARPSYLRAPARIYALSESDPCEPGDTPLVEIPVSIYAPRRLPRWLETGKLASLSTMPLYSRRMPLVSIWRQMRPDAPVWLRPAFSSLNAMRRVGASLAPAGYLQAMCHSNEFWPGASPYTSDAAECDAFFARLEGIGRWALEHGYQAATLIEAARALAPQSAPP